MEQLSIIGNGMAGIACLEQILARGGRFDITVFGEEPHTNYNRILLSSVLAGEKQLNEITTHGLDWYRKNGINLRMGTKIVRVETNLRTIIAEDGGITRYDKLIFATGSSPFVPPISGVTKRNVFTFRNREDTEALLRATAPDRRAVVIGGGLLGLEAARGLQLRGCDVTVVHLDETLMERQLDALGGAYLARAVEEMGIQVLRSRRTRAILGGPTAEGVEFADGQRIAAGLVVIAAGIQPNVGVARQAGIACNRGIVVNDYMETSDPNVFAVGECVEHKGETFGLVAPLFAQGKALAARLTAGREIPFEGWKSEAKLKVMGVDVFSAGQFQETPDTDIVRHEELSAGIYKKLLIRNRRLVGVVLVGDASNSNVYTDWLRSETDLPLSEHDLLFPEQDSLADWPDSHQICDCMSVTKGTIVAAIRENGLCTLAEVKDYTFASTGCGTCTPLCEGLLQAEVPGYIREASASAPREDRKKDSSPGFFQRVFGKLRQQ